jgi:tRNA(Arg) A34 adenosine deaminase TadA
LGNIFIESLLFLFMDHRKFMRLAIDKGRGGKIPFAACIVKNNKVLACEYSSVFPNNDPTAHGEIQAIRANKIHSECHEKGMSGAFR